MAHRLRRAEDYEREAKRRELQARAARGALYTDTFVREAGRWYRSRAEGQRERIDRVHDCRSAETLTILCGSCGEVRQEPRRCSVRLLCVSCRGKIAARKRAQFLRARESVLDEARAKGLLFYRRKGGRFSEKFLTLTAPHVSDHSVHERICSLLRAWGHFAKQFNRYFRELGAKDDAHWMRATEWEPGHDLRGHPHFHVWMFCPFLPKDLVERWWRVALLKAGYKPQDLTWVIFRLQEIRDPRSAAAEIIKYITKDVTSDGHLLDPELFAEAYRALEGHRITQASRGFAARGRWDAACSCGATAWVTPEGKNVSPFRARITPGGQ